MRRIVWIGPRLLVASLVLLAGCAQAPDAELAAAKASIEAARAAEAGLYAPSELQRAEASLAAAQSELAAQAGKFAPLRNYSQAKGHLESARRAGEEARVAAVSGKEQARLEAGNLANEVRAQLEQTRKVLRAIPRSGGGRQVVGSIEEDLDRIEADVARVDSLANEGRYDAARVQGRRLLLDAQSLGREVEDALDRRLGGK